MSHASLAGASILVMACFLAQGCSSGSSGGAGSSGGGTGGQVQAARAAVQAAAENLYRQIVAAGAGWTAVISGGYQACTVSGSSNDMLQYTATEIMQPFSHAVSFAVFTRELVATLNALGWDLRSVSVPQSTAQNYAGRDGHLDLRVIAYDQQPGLGSTGTLYVSNGCFSGGSAAAHLIGEGSADTVHEPRPTSTPTPKYS